MKKEELKALIKECIIEQQTSEKRRRHKQELLKHGRRILDEMKISMKKEFGI